MKKDIEWAKNRIKNTLKFEALNDREVGFKIAMKEALELINQLDEPEVLSQLSIDNNGVHVRNLGETFEVVSVESLPVPKQELPVIPKYVADWITKYHEKFDLYPALKKLEDNSSTWESTYKWYRTNTRKFVNAYFTGEYEVEEEPLYRVSAGCMTIGFWFLCKDNDGDIAIGTNKDYYDRKWESLKLTEQEIKDFDERYWAFAVKVEKVE